jgi:hydroxyacylglutathione hydrolase
MNPFLRQIRQFSSSARRTMRVVPVPVREDNYAYLLIDEPSNQAAAVDVFDTDKVTAKAKELGVNLVAALTTHHHFDHSGGNKVSIGYSISPCSC